MRNLKQAVLEKIKTHTEYYSGKIFVTEQAGIVELSGYVEGEVAKASLEGLARTVSGVKEVINHLKIESLSTSGVQGLRIS